MDREGGGKGQDKLPCSQWMHAVVQGSAIRVVVPDRFMDCKRPPVRPQPSIDRMTDQSPSLARRRRPAEEAPIYIRNETDKRISGDARTEINLNKAACNGHTTRRRSFADRRRMCRHGTGVEGGKSRGERDSRGRRREGTKRLGSDKIREMHSRSGVNEAGRFRGRDRTRKMYWQKQRRQQKRDKNRPLLLISNQSQMFFLYSSL